MCKMLCILKDVSRRGEVPKGLWGNPGERKNLEDLGRYGKRIIKWTFEKWKGGGLAWTGLIWLGIWTDNGAIVNVVMNETWRSKKCGAFLD
jgi:hypothetical protein